MKGPSKSNITDIMLRWEFKFIVTICLLLLAFTEYTKTPDAVQSLCLWGMAFSTVGDLFLMDYMNVPSYIFKGKQFYAGAASFCVAHMIYRQMFRTLNPAKNIWGLGEWIALAILLVLCVLLFCVRFKKRSPAFWGAAGFYTGQIFMHLAAAINCVIALEGKHTLALVGVVCFIISDFFLLVREVKNDTPVVRKLIWVFYPIAQILVILNV